MIDRLAHFVSIAAPTVDAFGEYFLSASIDAVLLIVLIFALRAAMGRWLSPSVRCALWCIVGLRLLVPLPVFGGLPAFRGVWSLATIENAIVDAMPSIHANANRSILGAPKTVAAEATPPLTKDSPTWTKLPIATPLAPAASIKLRSSLFQPSRIAISIWLVGVGIAFARAIYSKRQLRRALAATSPVEDPRILRLAADAVRSIGVRISVKLVWTDRVRSPAICGTRRPTLLLPRDILETLDDAEVRLLLLHEFAHVRRHDVRLGSIARFVRALHWFNPFVWIACRALQHDCELACDAVVLRHAGADARDAYGATLLRVIERVCTLRPQPATLGAFGTRRALARRINMIASYDARRSWTTRIGSLLALLAVGFIAITCGPRNGMHAVNPQTLVPAASQPTTPSDVWTEPAKNQNADLSPEMAKLLDTPIPELRFDGVPLTNTIDFLRDTTHANIFVNWTALEAAGIDGKTPITQRLRNVKLAKVLSLVLHQAGNGIVKLGYTVGSEGITISTQDDLEVGVDTRTFDIRDMLVWIPDGSDALTLASSRPNTLGVDQQMIDERVQRDTARRAQIVQQIEKVITDTIDAESWKTNGGLIGAIQELGGQLIVTQTPTNLERVEALLVKLHANRAIQVSVSARFCQVDADAVPQNVSALLKANNAATDAADKTETAFLSPAQTAELLRSIHGEKETTLTAPRLTLFSGQRAYVLVSSQQTYISDFTLTRDDVNGGSKRTFAPKLDNVPTGVLFDVEATASADRKYVTLTLAPKVAHLLRMETEPFAGAPDEKGLVVQKPVVETQQMNATISVPDRGTIVLRSGPTGGEHPQVLLLLVTPTVIVPTEATTQPVQ